MSVSCLLLVALTKEIDEMTGEMSGRVSDSVHPLRESVLGLHLLDEGHDHLKLKAEVEVLKGAQLLATASTFLPCLSTRKILIICSVCEDIIVIELCCL